MKEFYFYTEKAINKTINEMFPDFEIHTISREAINKKNFSNKNILLILNENLPKNLNDFFFLQNNVVIFYLNKNYIDKKKYFNTKIFSRSININKFIDEVVTFFVSKLFIYKDIKIIGEKIINLEYKKETFLTPSEKKILILLCERNKIQKNFLLESVLKLKKDTETKTIESHLTRIRKKLQSINSEIELGSKENVIFVVN